MAVSTSGDTPCTPPCIGWDGVAPAAAAPLAPWCGTGVLPVCNASCSLRCAAHDCCTDRRSACAAPSRSDSSATSDRPDGDPTLAAAPAPAPSLVLVPLVWVGLASPLGGGDAPSCGVGEATVLCDTTGGVGALLEFVLAFVAVAAAATEVGSAADGAVVVDTWASDTRGGTAAVLTASAWGVPAPTGLTSGTTRGVGGADDGGSVGAGGRDVGC